MKNKLLLSIGLVFLYGTVTAQARDGTADLQRTKLSEPAAILYLPYSPDVTRKAFSKYLSKTSNRQQKNAIGYSLSGNTVLAKNNVDNADMHFLIGYREGQKRNESVIYLKLNSFSRNENGSETTAYLFDMQEAKDYLDNLAVAIQPYAAALQLRSQQKDLADSELENMALTEESGKLEAKRILIYFQTNENENYKRDKGLANRKTENDKKINVNNIALAASNSSIKQQTAAIVLLKQ